jgi:hypothetical protein
MVVVTDANGATKTLDSNARDPADRPRGINFSTKLGAGFDIGGFTLSRLIDRDNVDIHLADDVKLVAANGDTAYEGFIGELPRSMDTDGHTLSVNTAGWMAHAADEPFTMIFVDRDLSRWGPASRQRNIACAAGTLAFPATPEVMQDEAGSINGLRLQHQSVWASPIRPLAEGWYDAGDRNLIGRVYYDFTTVGSASTADANWGLQYRLTNTDDASIIRQDSGDVWASVPTASAMSDIAPGSRYAFISFFYIATPGGADSFNYAVHARKLAVWGNHGLNLYGTAEPYGVLASDVIRYLARLYCPKLNTNGVENTQYPISHLVFLEDTAAYDAWLKVNSYHLWNLAVWEDRTLYYSPTDLTDWDWEIRHDEVGNQIGLQGDSVENLRNGVIVQFTNAATGTVEKLHPDDHTELRDTSIDNPYNQHGRKKYDPPFVIPFPTLQSDALELGRLRLLEDNQAKAPGSFTVQGHIKDRAGNYQPAWKVRAGDRIRLTSSVSLSARPRPILETNYIHDSATVTIGVDSTLRLLEGYIDRVTTALQAAGLGG